MFMLPVLLLLVAPVPVVPLLSAPEAFNVDVALVPFVKPTPVSLVLTRIPIVIVPVIGIVYPSLAFSLFVPLAIPIILWRGHGKGAQRRQQCS